jgi:hypothetical protein
VLASANLNNGLRGIAAYNISPASTSFMSLSQFFLATTHDSLESSKQNHKAMWACGARLDCQRRILADCLLVSFSRVAESAIIGQPGKGGRRSDGSAQKVLLLRRVPWGR